MFRHNFWIAKISKIWIFELWNKNIIILFLDLLILYYRIFRLSIYLSSLFERIECSIIQKIWERLSSLNLLLLMPARHLRYYCVKKERTLLSRFKRMRREKRNLASYLRLIDDLRLFFSSYFSSLLFKISCENYLRDVY